MGWESGNYFSREISRANIKYVEVMFKLAIQKIIRFVNILLFKKELPNKISIYFHEISKMK